MVWCQIMGLDCESVPDLALVQKETLITTTWEVTITIIFNCWKYRIFLKPLWCDVVAKLNISTNSLCKEGAVFKCLYKGIDVKFLSSSFNIFILWPNTPSFFGMPLVIRIMINCLVPPFAELYCVKCDE